MELKSGYKQTEVGVIPEEWGLAPFSDLFEFRNGVNAEKHAYGHGIRFINVLEVITQGHLRAVDIPGRVALSKAAIDSYAVYRGDLVFNRTSETQEEVGLASVYLDDEPVVFGGFVIRGRPKSGVLDPRYSAYALRAQAIRTQIIAKGQGAIRANVGQADLRQVCAPIPPLPEQRAIAAALGDADALIVQLEELIAKKCDLKQAAMQQLLTGQRRLPGFGSATGRFKKTEAGLLPEDWESRPFLRALRIATGQVNPRLEPYKSMILVAPDHIESATGRLLERQTASAQAAISGKYLFAPGDIVYSKIRPYLRKAIYADFQGVCSADMYPLTPVPDVSGAFAWAVLLGHDFSTFAENVSVRSGIPKINREELAQYKMALPPLVEQAAIAAVLFDMDAELTKLEQWLAKTSTLRLGMMQELLTGRTRLV